MDENNPALRLSDFLSKDIVLGRVAAPSFTWERKTKPPWRCDE